MELHRRPDGATAVIEEVIGTLIREWPELKVAKVLTWGAAATAR